MGDKLFDQYQSARLMYSIRAHDYEDSWHPEYTQRFMEIARAQPGDRVLSLACGTGLDAIQAARDVGDNGYVVGIDATPEMLEVARSRLAEDPSIARRLRLIEHNVCRLDTCVHIQENSFDLILCSNAFVLFDDPAQVIAHWRNYLRVGGRVCIDITHEFNLHTALVMEAAVQRLSFPFPFHRRWVKSKNTFSEMLEAHGFIVEKVVTLAKQGKGNSSMNTSQADQEFDHLTSLPLLSSIATDEFKTKVRPLFHEEWMAASVDGNLEEVDQLYAYVARKV